MFCVECGKEGELIGPLCPECHSRKHVSATLPEHIDLVMCSHCSAFLIGGKWQETGSVKDAVEDIVRGVVEVPRDVELADVAVQLDEKDERTYEAEVSMTLLSRGHEFRRDATVVVRLKRGSCKECSKQMGSYYEAILQVRGDDRALGDEAETRVLSYVSGRVEAMRADSRSVFITRTERVKGGIDFYLGTARSGRVIARELQDMFCAEYKESTSLWGQREGKEVYRVTFLVRLPGFSVGDVVTDGTRDLYVRGMSKGHVRFVDLSTGEERQARFRAAAQFALVRPSAGIPSAVVLMEGEDEIQVLDPDTMASLDLRKPKGFVREGEQIRVVKTNLGAYVLSDSW